jgi:hypothetical protein
LADTGRLHRDWPLRDDGGGAKVTKLSLLGGIVSIL